MYPPSSGTVGLVASGCRDYSIYVWRRRGEQERRSYSMRSNITYTMNGHKASELRLISFNDRDLLVVCYYRDGCGVWGLILRDLNYCVLVGLTVLFMSGTRWLVKWWLPSCKSSPLPRSHLPLPPPLSQLNRKKHKAAVLSLALPNANTLITTCHDKAVREFDLRTPISVVADHRRHKKAVLALAVNGQYVYTGGEGNTVCVWDRRSRDILQNVKVCHPAIISLLLSSLILSLL